MPMPIRKNLAVKNEAEENSPQENLQAKNPAPDAMPAGNFYIIFLTLLLGGIFLLTGSICILHQGGFLFRPHKWESTGSYVVSRSENPQPFWAAVVISGAIGILLLLVDLRMLARHRRAGRGGTTRF